MAAAASTAGKNQSDSRISGEKRRLFAVQLWHGINLTISYDCSLLCFTMAEGFAMESISVLLTQGINKLQQCIVSRHFAEISGEMIINIMNNISYKINSMHNSDL